MRTSPPFADHKGLRAGTLCWNRLRGIESYNGWQESRSLISVRSGGDRPCSSLATYARTSSNRVESNAMKMRAMEHSTTASTLASGSPIEWRVSTKRISRRNCVTHFDFLARCGRLFVYEIVMCKQGPLTHWKMLFSLIYLFHIQMSDGYIELVRNDLCDSTCNRIRLGW